MPGVSPAVGPLGNFTGPAVRRAFDLTREAPATRDQYGRHPWGQSCLLARRLVEAGCRFVTVFFDAYGLNAGGWDTHTHHFARLREFLLPVFDRAFAVFWESRQGTDAAEVAEEPQRITIAMDDDSGDDDDAAGMDGGRRFHFTDPSGNELAVWSDR